MRSAAFRAAVESRDKEAIVAQLAPDVRFWSPVTFRPYEGREVVGLILTEGAMRVFSDFSYRNHFEDGDSAALVFSARVGEREVDGLDLARFGSDGLIAELTVMVRPMSGVHALAEAMGKRFAELGIGSPDAPPGGG